MSLSAEQHAARQLGIGGSDAAVALGLSKWKTPFELYLEKRGEIERSQEETQFQYWGKKLEPVVRQEYSDRTGYTVRQPTGTIWHPDYDWMCAHVDGVIPEHKRGYEGKCAIQYVVHEWGESGTDQVPDEYLIQCQHYMIVYGMPVWDLAALIGGNDYRQYEIPEDKELQEMIIEGEKDFARRVREGDPPPLNYEHRSALDLLKKLYPGTNGKRIVADKQAELWRRRFDKAARLEKRAKEIKDAYKARMLELMGEAAILAFADGKAYRRKRIEKKPYTVEPEPYIDARFVNDPDAPTTKRKGARK